jgi:hypothetical protein
MKGKHYRTREKKGCNDLKNKQTCKVYICHAVPFFFCFSRAFYQHFIVWRLGARYCVLLIPSGGTLKWNVTLSLHGNLESSSLSSSGFCSSCYFTSCCYDQVKMDCFTFQIQRFVISMREKNFYFQKSLF